MLFQNVYLHNVAELIDPPGADGVYLARIPSDVAAFINEGARSVSCHPAGCEIRFNLHGEQATVILEADQDQREMAEVWQGCFPVTGWHLVDRRLSRVEVQRPMYPEDLDRISGGETPCFDPKLVRILLPYRPKLRLVAVEGDISPAIRSQMPDLRCIAYGSSITQGAQAVRPSGTYVFRTAQLLKADATNLGFSGSAHCDRGIADWIALRQDWDFAILELGINMVKEFSEAAFKKRISSFIERIAEAHPDRWIFCIDMFLFLRSVMCSPEKRERFRGIVKDAVHKLDKPKLVHLSGAELLRTPTNLTTDLVHPSPAGMEEIAVSLARAITEKMRNPNRKEQYESKQTGT
jgi:lysophospholipase L1-like esterase